MSNQVPLPNTTGRRTPNPTEIPASYKKRMETRRAEGACHVGDMTAAMRKEVRLTCQINLMRDRSVKEALKSFLEMTDNDLLKRVEEKAADMRVHPFGNEQYIAERLLIEASGVAAEDMVKQLADITTLADRLRIILQ